jgi:hypothetical protein
MSTEELILLADFVARAQRGELRRVMSTELPPGELDPDPAIATMMNDSEHVRARASEACRTSVIAISRSELLRDRLEALHQRLVEFAWRPSVDLTAVVEIEPDPVLEVPGPKPARGRRTLEAHFAISAIVVDGEPWTVRYASLDVYHQGPDFDDPTAAIWEVQCTTAPGARRLEVRREYSVVIDARNGRRFAGRVFTQHSSSEICTLLDTGEPLEGLESADYLD